MSQSKKQNRWTDEELLQQIHAVVGKFGRVPSYSEWQEHHSPPCHMTYWERFGGFTHAVEEAGYTPRSKQPKYSEEELLEWIDAFVEEFGVVPSTGDIDACPGPSQTAYMTRFGSWTNAVEAAGYTPRGEQ